MTTSQTERTASRSGVHSFEAVARHLDEAAQTVFGSDVRVQAVGIGRDDAGAFCFRAVRNVRRVLALSAASGAVDTVQGIPVVTVDAIVDPLPHLKVPARGPGSPTAASVVQEQGRHRPLVSGLQIENWDDDDRKGHHANGHIVIGTLGCFVSAAGRTCLLSNNHVVAGENAGVTGADRIVQPGDLAVSPGDVVATLQAFEPLVASPAGATVAGGNVMFNVVDAGIAAVDAAASWTQGYLPSRKRSITGTATPKIGDRVFKVGRTTGLTVGGIVSVSDVVGPIPYDLPGVHGAHCWFRDSFTVEGDNGTTFSDHGDSGSAIVKDTGEIVGLLYAGNGTQTYACAIANVLAAFSCALA
jgi:hypothetical protein